MKTALRRRPRLDVDLAQVLEAARRYGRVVAASRELGCTDAYLHVRMRRVGLTLAQVLESPGLSSLLYGHK